MESLGAISFSPVGQDRNAVGTPLPKDEVSADNAFPQHQRMNGSNLGTIFGGASALNKSVYKQSCRGYIPAGGYNHDISVVMKSFQLNYTQK